MSISIRKAAEGDAPFLAQMMLQSSRASKKVGLFDLVFDTDSEDTLLECLGKLTLSSVKNHCHYTNFLVAEVDGKSVGTLCSYEPRISTQESFIEALEEIGCAQNAKEKLSVLSECDFGLNKRTLMFDFMEELEEYKDVGILKELMRKSLLTARLKGYRIAQTIIEIGSLESMLFYKKLGFKEVEERECEAYKEKFGRLGLVLLSTEF